MSNDNTDLVKDLTPQKRRLLLQALTREARDSLAGARIRRAGGSGSRPLSLAQQRLWFLNQLNPNSLAYNELAAMSVTGALDTGVLERSLTELVRRHEILRTTFGTEDGMPVQVIAPAAALPLAVTDDRERSAPEQDAAVAQLIADEARAPFDLARGPLLRVSVIRLRDEHSVLVVAAHHIIVDGWSMGIFRRELAAVYAGLQNDESPALPELPVQYADFAVWQRETLREDDLSAQLAYWKRQLAALPPALQLTVAKPRPADERFDGARRFLRLGADLTDEVRALSRRANVTPFMTLLAAFQILLARYSGQTDIPVGTVVANRNQPEIENLIGFFVNTLVMRGDLSGTPTVLDLLDRTCRTVLEAYEFQDLPFDQVVEALQPQRLAGYHPLFQAVFNFQKRPPAGSVRTQLNLETMPITDVPAKFDLILSLEETPDGLDGYWEYNRDLFDPETIERMSGHYLSLLRGMAAAPERPVRALPTLTGEERRTLSEWSRNQPDREECDRCIHELFEEHAARAPGAVALVYRDAEVTYGELNLRAAQIARRLSELGVGPESLVAICAPRSAEAVAAVLGVLKAGGAYVPLDPAYPRERLAQVLSDASPAVILAERDAASSLPQGTERVAFLDEIDATGTGTGTATATGAADGRHGVTPDNLAYVIYTSGSTGRPKGVMITHRNLVRSTAARWSYYAEPVSSFLLLPSLAFDSSIAGLFWTLTQGGTLVLPDDADLLDVPALCRLISTRNVSHMLCIPSLHAAILQEAGPPQIEPLRTVIVAGQTCPAKLVEDHRRRLPDVPLFNEYGPTEATVWSTVHACTARAQSPVPIGCPIPGAEVYILDAHLQPVPALVHGELHVGGAGVARGYLNAPGLTAEKFIPAEMAGVPGARMYKTGDVARYLPDGTIELVGRADQQVKIRGYRVELGEIESTLAQYPGVAEAVVTVAEDDGEKRLVAHVSADGAPELDPEQLRRFAQDRLPGYMVPPKINVLDALPRLPNGKIDRSALAAVDDSPSAGSVDEAAWSHLEREIAEIWRATLNIPSARREDNFFSVGGDSLSMIRVYNRLRHITDKLAITDLFKHPTIVSLAEFIEADSVVGEI